MALEKKWNLVPPQPFVADGGEFGLITLASAHGFKTKQSAYLTATGLPNLAVQVKRVPTPTTLIVGTINNAQIASWPPLNISAYTVALNAAIGAQIQDKSRIGIDDIDTAVYEADPTVAIRGVAVDQYGNFYDDDNPLPVAIEGSISISTVEVKGTNGNYIEPNPDGSINVVVESGVSTNPVINTYNQVAVASGATVQIVTYTVPGGKTAILQRSAVSGENIGRYDIFINGVIQDTVRTMFGGDLTQMFDFTDGIGFGLPLVAGDIVTVQVNNPRPYSANYNARIQVLLVS
jgi:hypothetical protein